MSENKEAIIARIKYRLEEIDKERGFLLRELEDLEYKISTAPSSPPLPTPSTINARSTPEEKIFLFRNLFRGREDVYPRLWVSKNSGKKGYSPVCDDEWIPDICKKPEAKCSACENRKFSSLTDDVIRLHLDGHITIGVYPLLQDETCYFLALDFDKGTWRDDAKASMSTCRHKDIPASLERSRSGNGGHVWIFFSEPVPARLARQMGTVLITETMERRYQLDMRSYDRLFPNQDTMPKGGFGNLISLPLQKIPREKENSIFIDTDFKPYADQWAYLSGVKRMSLKDVQSFAEDAISSKDIFEISTCQSEEDIQPWERTISFKKNLARLNCKLPEIVSVVLANRLYIRRDGLPSQLLIRIKRLASFQNPEFYRKQGMRLSTARTPRIICCAEDIDDYLAIPRGCLDDMRLFFSENKISLDIQDRRFEGNRHEFNFTGGLTEDQEKAYNELLKHETGVFVAPPGIGKTVIGIRLISERKTNTLILVHRKPILEQWRSRIASLLEIPINEIGQIGGGKNKATNIIDVAMIQSLYNREGVDKMVKNYGHIIADECHHISAVSFERVMMEANALYITGLTATPYRRDGHQPIITMQCGPVRYKIRPSESDGFSFEQKLITRFTNFYCERSEEAAITDILPFLIADEERNRIICDDVISNLKENRSPIILTERRKHLEILKEKLKDSVKHLVVLHGGMKSGVRKEMIERLARIPDNEGRLILATGSYIGEGFDDSRLDTLFIVMPFSFRGKMVQYAGRLHRSYKGKSEVRIYDYVDSRMPVFQKMYKKRLKAYKTLGYQTCLK